MRTLRNQKIRTRVLPDYPLTASMYLDGMLRGKKSYVRVVSGDGQWTGNIEGRRLYRLAKAIVRRYENAR